MFSLDQIMFFSYGVHIELDIELLESVQRALTEDTKGMHTYSYTDTLNIKIIYSSKTSPHVGLGHLDTSVYHRFRGIVYLKVIESNLNFIFNGRIYSLCQNNSISKKKIV